MAQIQRAGKASLHLVVQPHGARTIGKVSCQRKRPEAAARIERNLPSEVEATSGVSRTLRATHRRLSCGFVGEVVLAHGFSRGRAAL